MPPDTYSGLTFANDVAMRNVVEKMQVQKEMPKYKCYKEVHALQIAKVEKDSDLANKENRETTGGVWITPADLTYARFYKDSLFLTKHNPQPYGYYVVYNDGYCSFSPQKAFEEGYSRI